MKKFLIYVFVIVMILSFVITQSNEYDLILNKFKDSHPKELFKVYHSIFNKNQEYQLNSEEGIRRYKIFKANLLDNKKRNDELGSEIYGITQFTDLTQEEFVEKYLMKPEFRTKIDNTHNKEHVIKAVNPSGIDWTPNMGSIKDQGKCGSCWAFATLGAIEGNYNINYGGDKLDLSEQYLIDCDFEDKGCSGGLFKGAMSWIENNGVLLEKDLTYLERENLCRSNMKDKALNIGDGTVDFIDDLIGDPNKLIQMLNKGPLYVSVDATDLGNYKPTNNEPWVPKTCKEQNHAVIAVGYEIVNGEIILNLRNSWGTKWGINGHFKVNIKKSCLITTRAFLPKVKQNVPFPPPKCHRYSDQVDLKGNIYSTCEGVADFKDVIGGNLISYENNSNSVILDLYEKPNCLGKTAFLVTKNIIPDVRLKSSIREWFMENNKIPMIAPTGPASSSRPMSRNGGVIYFYEKPCYSGDYSIIKITKNIPDLSIYDIKFENVKSIFFREKEFIDYYGYVYGFILHEELNYKGKSFSFNKQYVNLEETLSKNPDIFKRAKSLSIIRVPE